MLDHIDPLYEKGYGFTVSDITVYVGTLQNGDVKQLLMYRYIKEGESYTGTTEQGCKSTAHGPL